MQSLRFVWLVIHSALESIRFAWFGQFVQHHHRVRCARLRTWHGGLHHLDFHRRGHHELGLLCRQVRPTLGYLDKWWAVAIVRPKASLVDVVEKGKKPVEVLLRDRVELVIVAARTGEREPEKHSAYRLNAVGHVFDDPFVRNRAGLGVDTVVAVEAGGHLREKVSVWNQVARHLLGDESVERHVIVERLDQPIAPHPHVAQSVVLVAVGIRVARCLHPAYCHVLSVTWRVEQAIHHPRVGPGGIVAQECVEFSERWQQSGEIQRHATEQGGLVGLWRRC